MKNWIVLLTNCLLVSIICSCDWKAEIAVVKNSTTDTVLVAMTDKETFTDSVLYHQSFADFLIPPNQSKIISVSDVKPKYAADSERVQLYFINYNTLLKFQKQNKVKNIVKNTLLMVKTIQLNRVSYPLDTLYCK